MPSVARQGDQDSGGGTLVSNYSGDVFVNGKNMAHVGTNQSPHPPHPRQPIHGSSHITSGVSTVFVNGKSVAHVGSKTLCGHDVSSGSGDVFVDDLGSAGGGGGGFVLPESYSPAATEELRKEAGRFAPLDDPDTVDLVPSTYGPDSAAPPVKEATDANVQTTESNTPVLPGCGSITTIDYEEYLSTHFKLKQYSNAAIFPHSIKPQAGFTAPDIICNLKALSIEVMEKVYEKYPGFRINSGFRSFTKGSSQHEKGMACDIQWPGLAYAEYLVRAKWIAENLVFDQLIFEHGNSIWLHLSFNRTVVKQRKQILTMLHGKYQPGLKLYY